MTVKRSKAKTSCTVGDARFICRRVGDESVRKFAAAEGMARNSMIRPPSLEEAIKFEKTMEIETLIKGVLTE